MIYNSFSESDYINNDGKPMYGRVKEYVHMRGFGFIFTELHNEIFVSSYDLGKQLEKIVCLGSTLRFVPEKRNGKFVASNIELINNDSADDYIEFPNDLTIKIKKIASFDLISGKTTIREASLSESDLLSHGYDVHSLDYLRINLNSGQYRFFDSSSPIDGDGKIDNLKDFYNDLVRKYYYL